MLGISLATYLLPTLTGLAAAKKLPEFRQTLSQGLGYLAFTNLVAAAIALSLAVPIVRLIFERGRFDADATQRVALSLACLAPGLLMFSMNNIVARAFYAVNDIKTPMKISLVCLALNLGFALWLIRPYRAYMRPVFHAKSDRFVAKAGDLEKRGVARLAVLKASKQAEYDLLRQAIAHLVLSLGGEDETDTRARIAAYEAKHGPISDAELVEAIAAVLLTEAFNHRNLQAVDGRMANGMSVMAMAAHTGCNTVYGSTAPNNPHPYPWMNSLFQ